MLLNFTFSVKHLFAKYLMTADCKTIIILSLMEFSLVHAAYNRKAK